MCRAITIVFTSHQAACNLLNQASLGKFQVRGKEIKLSPTWLPRTDWALGAWSRVVLLCAAPGTLPSEEDFRQRLPFANSSRTSPNRACQLGLESVTRYKANKGHFSDILVEIMEWRFFSQLAVQRFTTHLQFSPLTSRLFKRGEVFLLYGADPCEVPSPLAARSRNSSLACKTIGEWIGRRAGRSQELSPRLTFGARGRLDKLHPNASLKGQPQEPRSLWEARFSSDNTARESMAPGTHGFPRKERDTVPVPGATTMKEAHRRAKTTPKETDRSNSPQQGMVGKAWGWLRSLLHG